MSGSARQSYYEIALTNRQVLSVFVVLLVAVLAAFLAGVWVGKRAPAPRIETVEARAIESAGESDAEPIARLDFFSRGGEGDGEPAAPPETETAPQPEPAAAPPPAAEPRGPEFEAEPAPAAASPPAVPKKPEPQPAPAQPAPAPAEPAPAPAQPAGTLVVQVFSSNNQVQAQGVVDRLRSGGYPALLSPVEVAGRTMYRVRIGPYSDRRVAEDIAEQVRRDFRLETWITE